jgi:hypothetical protein
MKTDRLQKNFSKLAVPATRRAASSDSGIIRKARFQRLFWRALGCGDGFESRKKDFPNLAASRANQR